MYILVTAYSRRVLCFRTNLRHLLFRTSQQLNVSTMSKSSTSASSATTNSASSTTSIVWYKYNDLRIHDHEPLVQAHNISSTQNVIHCFIFDPFWFGPSKFNLPKMTYYKARFLLESVADLRNQLQSKGCDLLIRTGSSSTILPALAQLYGATVIYTHEEVCTEERTILRQVENELKRTMTSARVQRLWGGSTMYGIDDIPFTIDKLPDTYSNFRRKVEENCTLGTPLEITAIKTWKKFPASEASTLSPTLRSTLSTILSNDPSVFPYAYNNIQGKGVNTGMGKIPSLEVLGTSDLRPLYRTLGIPEADLSDQWMGIWKPLSSSSSSSTDSSTSSNTSSSTSTTNNQSSSSSSNPPLYYETMDEIINLPHYTDKRTVLPFRGGETVGLQRLQHYLFTTNALQTYKETRNGLLGSDYSSKFSPWLAFGCLSPRKIAAEVKRYERTVVANESTYWMLFELLWRDYFRFYALKYGSAIFRLDGPRGLGPVGVTENHLSNGSNGHSVGSNPNNNSSSTKSIPPKVWRKDNQLRTAWCLGSTGYPFVDANMRELLATGFMSNRGRQNVASFFVRDLEQDWRFGGEWFESLLIDHDPASNYGNWTYVAGVGADPREDRYFLIPKQARDYDPRGLYIRQWLPNLAAAPTEGLLDPAKLSEAYRGNHYPAPVVQLMAHRRGFPSPKDNRKNNFKATGGAQSRTNHASNLDNDTTSGNMTPTVDNNHSDTNGSDGKKRNHNNPRKKHSRVQHF